jgi:feruloyl esterase
MAWAFSDADLRIVADAVAKACDAEDGVVDGMVQDVTHCTTARVRPALDARICAGAKTTGCLSRDQVDTLVRALAGPHNAKGHALYASWPWDVGLASPGWRVWKMGFAGSMTSINVMLGSPALSGLFVTPPETVASTNEANLRYQLGFDFDRDSPRIFATTAEFPRSGWDLVGAQSTNLDRFRRHGGKMIVPHGGSDPIFSINDTIGWWRSLDTANDGKADRFVRVYAVPGMNHCAGGPSTDQFDALGALVAWVEKGQPPDRIEAAAGPATPWPGRTRPLCPYPAVARYRSGDINRAESFVCERSKT